MSKRKSLAVIGPRKEPKQQRSRQTYQIILNGALEIIRREGLTKLSTNRVAEESGVSIGSLYQYFPSKAAIIAALIDQILDQEFTDLKALIDATAPHSGAREVAHVFFARYYRLDDKDLELRRALIGAVPIVERASTAMKFHSDMADMIIQHFRTHFEVPIQDFKIPAFILQYLLKGITLSSVDDQIETMCRLSVTHELSELFLNLLQVPEAARGPRS